MARAVLPHMLAAKKGRVVTVTTSLGTMVREGFHLYGSSKAAAESAMGFGRQRCHVESAGTWRRNRYSARRQSSERC
jgi:NADP-dependent 3-hydroxy acid dehydrogenase YdfG